MDEASKIGDRYQAETRYKRNRMSGGWLRQDEKPDTYKTYPNAENIPLPEPERSGGEVIWDVFSRRRSFRGFSSASLPVEKLSQMLWATQGITAMMGPYALRTAPSAGALYPVETYILINRVEDIEPGIYHYNIRQHGLDLLKKGKFGADVAQAGLDQQMLNKAAFVLIWTAVVERSKWKYRERAYRYIYMDAGHIGQNAYLAAEALELGCCSVGAFFDDEVDSLIGIDGEKEICIYLCAIGGK